MKPLSTLSLFALVLFAAVLPLHAQGGCTDSPENPTAILLLAGTASVVLPQLRARWRARKSK